MRTSLAIATLVCALAVAAVGTQAPRFYDDDPISREPDPQDASKVEPWDIGLLYDLSYQLFATSKRKPSNTRAQNINTIDEVPDSSWFTNRIGAKALPVEELLRGTNLGPPPAAERWTVIREKSTGFAPGFTARSANGETWFLSFDPPSNPEGATGALAIANRIFWALGYNQVETFLTSVDPSHIDIDPAATTRRPSGARTPLTRDDLDEVMERAARNADGTYRAAAARLLPGKILGGFHYEDTRPDDPNDIVPHEHRRELRALRVFGAWTNLTDMKAGNTLDALVTENGRAIVKHYLQDVGSTFGIGANGPHDWDEGFEYFYEGGATRRRLFTFGFGLSPWQKAAYTEYPAIGRFEGDSFDPVTWKPHTPTAAYLEMRADDAFWAARRVMAFTDEMIRAVVKTGRVQRPCRRTIPGRRADQAARQDRTRLSHRRQPHRRSGAGWRGHVDVWQCRRAVWPGRSAGVVHGRVARVRQRHRHVATVRRNCEQEHDNAGSARTAPHPGDVHQSGPSRRQRRAGGVGAAHPGLLQEARERLETRWAGPDARASRPHAVVPGDRGAGVCRRMLARCGLIEPIQPGRFRLQEGLK